MNARMDSIILCAVFSCTILVGLISGTCMVVADPVITIDGNDDYYVWGSVNDILFPLHYIILIYGKYTDGKWYGPATLGNGTSPGIEPDRKLDDRYKISSEGDSSSALGYDAFPEITPDRKWKGRYRTDSDGDCSTAFRVYLIKKGVNMNQVQIQGAENIRLYYADVIAQAEYQKK
jgi:hypothetical protein